MRMKKLAMMMKNVAVLLILAGVISPAGAFAQSKYFYLVADTGGGPPGNDLLTLVDISGGTETPIGTGTGTVSMEGMTTHPGGSFSAQTMYGATSARLYLVNKITGVASALSSPYGTGSGALGNITFDDVDGIDFDQSTAPAIMYGVVRRGVGGARPIS